MAFPNCLQPRVTQGVSLFLHPCPLPLLLVYHPHLLQQVGMGVCPHQAGGGGGRFELELNVLPGERVGHEEKPVLVIRGRFSSQSKQKQDQKVDTPYFSTKGALIHLGSTLKSKPIQSSIHNKNRVGVGGGMRFKGRLRK